MSSKIDKPQSPQTRTLDASLTNLRNRRICHVSFSDMQGGAARAAYRIHTALNESIAAQITSDMRVARKLSDCSSVHGPKGKRTAISLARFYTGIFFSTLQRTSNRIHHSPACLPSYLDRELNDNAADLLHLHWINGEMLSIEAIGRLRKPLVWTLHDSWAFCGSEHHPNDLNDHRYQQGYLASNRPPGHHGLDLDRWCWQRKRCQWKRPIQIVCPSTWLANCVQRSALLGHWPVQVIPNPLPTQIYRPVPQALARQLFNLPAKVPLVLFGAVGGSRNTGKGWGLLEAALGRLTETHPDLQAVVFGQSKPNDPPQLGLPVHYVGTLHDDQALALLYSAADVMVVPSLMEAFGQTASEAQSCGVPVVAFNATGLSDVVEHRRTGYLATPYDPADLAHGISWVLDSSERRQALGGEARQRAERLWNPGRIAGLYAELYREVLSSAPNANR